MRTFDEITSELTTPNYKYEYFVEYNFNLVADEQLGIIAINWFHPKIANRLYDFFHIHNPENLDYAYKFLYSIISDIDWYPTFDSEIDNTFRDPNSAGIRQDLDGKEYIDFIKVFKDLCKSYNCQFIGSFKLTIGDSIWVFEAPEFNKKKIKILAEEKFEEVIVGTSTIFYKKVWEDV